MKTLLRKDTQMFTLLALIALPFVAILGLLAVGDMFGKKKTWNF